MIFTTCWAATKLQMYKSWAIGNPFFPALYLWLLLPATQGPSRESLLFAFRCLVVGFC